MAVISEKIVVSKYKAYHSIFKKSIDFKKYGIRVKNILQHKEIIKDVRCKASGDHVDINLSLEIYYTYCIEEKGESISHSSHLQEEVFLRVYKKDFKPVPYETDFYKCEMSAYFRNVNTLFDIDLNYSSIDISITAFVIVNLLRERCIEINEKHDLLFNEYFLNQVALSSDMEIKDAKDYFNNLENYSKVISRRIDELEGENIFCREELTRLESELSNRTDEYLDAMRKIENMSREYERLTERLKDMEEKYLKEQKKANLLEVENSRNLDELKSLRKEKNILLQKLEKNKTTLKDKIKLIISGEDKQ